MSCIPVKQSSSVLPMFLGRKKIISRENLSPNHAKIVKKFRKIFVYKVVPNGLLETILKDNKILKFRLGKLYVVIKIKKQKFINRNSHLKGLPIEYTNMTKCYVCVFS